MRAPISVIIPTLNAGMGLHRSLMCLMEAVEAGVIREVIVTDGGSTDETLEIAKDWGSEIVTGAPSRGGQLRRGCMAAKGDWFLILHADTVLSQGWSGAAGMHMQSDLAGWFSLRFDKGGVLGYLLAIWTNWRSSRGLPFGDQGLLIPRNLYEEVGGYQDIPLMEDVAISRALKGKLQKIDAVALTSAEKYNTQGWFRRGPRNVWLLARYFAGVSPETLAEEYRRR